jgi:hypothetical protein
MPNNDKRNNQLTKNLLSVCSANNASITQMSVVFAKLVAQCVATMEITCPSTMEGSPNMPTHWLDLMQRNYKECLANTEFAAMVTDNKESILLDEIIYLMGSLVPTKEEVNAA